ncbi:alpha-N-acetylglucosaminidase [Paenibacillus sp. MBLB4367]|uniref:alpha-N-acetylglucosaminidase n=1 Tax=Paenibacillus sp. MBLB4367 TaxID=3384767 RepID=UPI0039083454
MSGQEVVKGLLERLLPKHADQFVLETVKPADGLDVFEIDNRDGNIVLRGPNGVSIASALHWYLKYTCGCHVSWSGDQLELPDKLPPVAEPVRRNTPYRHRYLYNFCTFNYSMTWWDWARWEREIDWMALHGVNMPLAVTGQEAVWMATGRRLGLSGEDMLKHLTGPAYLAWHYMGNVDGMGGPLPQSWIDGQRELQLKILERQRAYGMTPVLSGFYGHVPEALKEKRPDANITQLKSWFGMPGIHFLDPRDPLFAEAAGYFYEEQERLYGTNHLYEMDLFHEGKSPDSSVEYLTESAKAVCKAMLENDSQAVWVMQSWSMSEPIVRALPDDHLILLDLYAETSPKWKSTEGFYGKPWIWCMLHNFGGRNGMHGSMANVANGPVEALHDPSRGHMAGIGFAPEAIEENPVLYDLLAEMTWHTEAIDLDKWTAGYLLRRYGKQSADAEEAWRLLRESVYAKNANQEAAVCARPKLEIKRVCNGRIVPFYDMATTVRAWETLLACGGELGGAAGYQYDLVDTGREVLSHLIRPLHLRIVDAFRNRDRAAFGESRMLLETVIADLDELTATNKHFLVGPWVASARKWGKTAEEKALHEFNARTLISTWWPRPLTFDDYSHRQWSGMLKGYYLERWKQFGARLEAAIDNSDGFDEAAFEDNIREWEIGWMNRSDDFAVEPAGDAVDVSRRMFDRYAALAVSLAQEAVETK